MEGKILMVARSRAPELDVSKVMQGIRGRRTSDSGLGNNKRGVS